MKRSLGAYVTRAYGAALGVGFVAYVAGGGLWMALGFFWIGGAVGLMAGSAWIAWTRNGLPVEDARLEEIRAMERWSEDAADDLAAARRAGSEPGLHLDHA